MVGKKVLVTGMSGLIGGAVRRQLEGKFDLSALNRRDVPGVRCHRANIADLDAILPAFEGIDAVVHLAASIRGDWEELLRDNVVGTYNVFEASRQAGAKRIVYASTGGVVAGWEREMPYRALVEERYEEAPETWERLNHTSPIRPRRLYGCTKVWGEALARHFVDEYDLSILCLRIGSVTAKDRPFQPRHFSTWCSRGDVARMVERCLAAPEDLRFDIFYVGSNNRWSYYDLEHASEVLGFVPQDAAEDYR